MKHERDQAAPHDWISIVNERADLDLAFETLEGWTHFHTDTIRGRIRSLQLRPVEAWEHFERAEARAQEFTRSVRNVLRRFYLKVYCFENAVIEESASEGASRSKTDERLKSLLEADAPESEVATHIRLFNNAVYLLHREEYTRARELFLRLLRESRKRSGDEKSGFYLGAAVAHRALGETAEAERQMENGALSIPALSNTFNMGIYAGSLAALLRIWGRDEEAKEWDEFLVRLRIPPKTAQLFRERSRRILERSSSLKRVFLF